MDPMDILYPNRPARDEFNRRFTDMRDWPMDKLYEVAQCIPDDAATAAERVCAALMENLPEAHAVFVSAKRFWEKSVRAAERPIKAHASIEWKSSWMTDFVGLHGRREGLVKAHGKIALAVRTWRETPGFGEHDATVIGALNGMGKLLNDALDLIEKAGATRDAPESAAA